MVGLGVHCGAVSRKQLRFETSSTRGLQVGAASHFDLRVFNPTVRLSFPLLGTPIRPTHLAAYEGNSVATTPYALALFREYLRSVSEPQPKNL